MGRGLRSARRAVKARATVMKPARATRRARRRRPVRHGRTRRSGASQNRNPQFEAIALTVDPGPRNRPNGPQRVPHKGRLARWRVDTVSNDEGQFELAPPKRAKRITPGAAWDAVLAARAAPGHPRGAAVQHATLQMCSNRRRPAQRAEAMILPPPVTSSGVFKTRTSSTRGRSSTVASQARASR